MGDRRENERGKKGVIGKEREKRKKERSVGKRERYRQRGSIE